MKAIRLLTLAALLGGATFAALSCGDQRPPTAQSDLLGLGSINQIVGLLACTPLPYDSVTDTIGPAGGTIQVGPHTFTVPPGSLDSNVAITAVMDADSINAVRFQPQGLQFQNPALLTLSYANCNLLFGLLPKHVAYVNDSLQILDYLPSSGNAFQQTITGHVQHFSEYAVAW
ncbi:MAG TPA: hypothetical protein VFK78_06280 [Gemmatimonadales bacterium]|nr:hypothetical protein [Gemmatimonadales bacterium]